MKHTTSLETATNRDNTKKNSLISGTKQWNKGFFKSFALAVILALSFRSLCFEPFNIPSGSMKPTLLIGDYIFVSKYAYGYSRYSFPLGLPLFKGRVGLSHLPQRGDVIVFKLPTNPRLNYIKRLIGLPGDRIQVKEGILWINEQPIPRHKLPSFTDRDGTTIARYQEQLPNGISYEILEQEGMGMLDNTGVYTVPEGHYFFMGDNRDNSVDSRVQRAVGFVPFENIIGRAEIIFFSSDSSLWAIWTWFTATHLDRFFTPIRPINSDIPLTATGS